MMEFVLNISVCSLGNFTNISFFFFFSGAGDKLGP